MANARGNTFLNRLADRAFIALLKHTSFGNSPFYSSFAGQTSTRAYKYTDYAKEGFQQNSTVYACIRLVYEAITNLNVRYKRDGELIDPSEIPADMLALDTLMKRPSLYQSQNEWMKQLITFWEIGGMAYIADINLGVNNLTNKKGEIIGSRPKAEAAMDLIRPDRVDILHNAGIITGYRIDGGAATIEPDKMMFVRFPDPMNMFQGMPPMRAAASAIDKSNSASTYSAKLFENSARPGGILAVNMPNASEDAITALREDFSNKYAGSKNAGKTVILNSDRMNYKQLSFSPKDMALDTTDMSAFRKICNAFGVPSQMLGDPETSKYSNYQEAQKDLYQNTAIPIKEHLMGELGVWLMPKYKLQNTEFVLDWSHIAFLNDDANDLTDRLSKATWLTDNEKRLAMGYEPLDDPSADELKKPQPAGMFTIPGKLETHQDVLESISPHSLFRTQESRDAFVNKQDDKRQPEGKKIFKAINEYWDKQEKLLLAWIPGVYADVQSLEKRGDTAKKISDMFKTNKQNELLFDALDDLEFNAMAVFGQDAMILAGSKALFDVTRPDLRAWLTEGLTERSHIINNTTADRLEILLDKAVEEGVGANEIKLRIQEKFVEMSKGRAVAISRTEIGMAQSRATVEGYMQAGTPQHEWVTARDGNVRDSHILLDGEIVDVGEPFSNGGIAPGMANIAEEDINCRCCTAPLNKGDEPI